MICVILFSITGNGGNGVKVLSFDPSGNYDEGKGTTGYCISVDGMGHTLHNISAEDFNSREAYWLRHETVITVLKPDVVVIESYRLFGHKAKEQSGSSLETAMLIGYLQMVCYKLSIPVFLQDPSTKSRHSDDVLVKSNVIEKRGRYYYFKGEKTNLHQRDSLRHDLYFNKYNKKKLEVK